MMDVGCRGYFLLAVVVGVGVVDAVAVIGSELIYFQTDLWNLSY